MNILVHFKAGPYWGYQFDADGNVTAKKPYTLLRNSGARADQRGPIPNRPGIWLHIINGIWNGYWIHEDEITDVAALVEAQIPDVVVGPPPPPPDPVPSGIPQPPAGYGQRFLKNFADGKMDPFYAVKYPDDHPFDKEPDNFMAQFCRYAAALTDPTLISVHDGFLDLGCRRRKDGSGLFDASFVTTGMPTPTAAFFNGLFRWMAEFPLPTGKADWRTLWLLDGNSWGGQEIDWGELIGGKATANIHGPNVPSNVAPIAIPIGWHEWGVDMRVPGLVRFLLDGTEKGRKSVSMPEPMAFLADSKVGLATPDATTPDMLRLHIAWAAVD